MKDLEKEKCTCNDACTCGDECHCTDEVPCHEDCNCTEVCEGSECHCEEDKNKKEKKHKKDDKLNKKVKELEDSLLRSQAEFINYRKRLEDEHTKMIKYSNEELIKQLLPTIDNFERAIDMDDVNLQDAVSKFLAGFKMIYCNFINTLKENGIVEIDGFNKPFDPVYHEAIMVEKREDLTPGTVIDVLQKGYILKGKVIRPAMVKVSE